MRRLVFVKHEVERVRGGANKEEFEDGVVRGIGEAPEEI